jgi:hypothetical protein
MLTSEVLAYLRGLENKSIPVIVEDPQCDERKPLTVVLHDPPRMFFSDEAGPQSYTAQLLIDRLEKLDTGVPFDAEVVYGDDWNFQVVEDLGVYDGVLIVKFSSPVMD